MSLGWIKSIDRNTLVRNSFLLPILLVVIISISHVTNWYSIGNPFSWAVYLSIALEIFALAAVSAASINMTKFSVWFLFCIVTSVQIIGNVFFTYNDIDVDSKIFKSWVEMIKPLFDDWSIIDHKRLLAAIQGGLLPVMSLTALHFYIKFGEIKTIVKTVPAVPALEVAPVGVEQKAEQKPVGPNTNNGTPFHSNTFE